jgi:predicted ATP-grasp superfamily ATP-dependent carboligase
MNSHGIRDALSMTYSFESTPAVVVGACAHGLAMVYGLASGNVPVLLVEAEDGLHALLTRYAVVHRVESMSGERLLEALEALRREIVCPGQPVLMLTNDAMVQLIGSHQERISRNYCLAWAHCADRLLPLLDKRNIESQCNVASIRYPRSVVVNSSDDLTAALSLGFPLIIKPNKPLSGFKTFIPDSPAAARAFVERNRHEFPLLVQEFIPGDDQSIHFSALYLDHGRTLARFDGHKLRSWPLGHTTIAESCRNDDVHILASRFFDGLDISGPVSLELKRGPEGDWWVIEPTVGRTDFWVGVCIANGVNLPLIEYLHQTGQKVDSVAQLDVALWFNEERDPYGPLWFFGHPGLRLGRRRPTFCYFGHDDPSVSKAATRTVWSTLLRPFAWRLKGLLSRLKINS